jgi:HlyD family secretion protein
LKIAAIVLVVLGLMGGVAYFVFARARAAAAQAGVTEVRVEPAVRGSLIESVSAPGEIQPLTKVSISAKVAAPIVKMPFKDKEGAPVHQGDLLVKLDDDDLQAIKRQLEAQRIAQEKSIQVARERIDAQHAAIRASEATLADLKRDLDRNTSLVSTHDVSQSVLDTAQAKYDGQLEQIASAKQNLVADETNLKVMASQLVAAQAQVDKAQKDIDYTTITSPIDGTVTSVKAEVGEMVVTGTMNNAGTVIMEVADLDKMIMVARVDESQIDAVKKNQHAVVRIQAYRDQVFDGTVYTVGESRTTDQLDMTKYFEVKIALDRKGRRIRSGLSADVEIETQSHADAIKIPSQAVMGRPLEQLPADLRHSPDIERGKSFATVVFRCINNKAVITPVTVGPSDDTHTAIKAGLNANDPVIVGPYKILESLQDGQAVKLESAPPSTQPSSPKVVVAQKQPG